MPNDAEADAAVSLRYTIVITPQGVNQYTGRVLALGTDCLVTETTLAATRSSLERALCNELTVQLLQGNSLLTNLIGKQYESAAADITALEFDTETIVGHVDITVATQ